MVWNGAKWYRVPFAIGASEIPYVSSSRALGINKNVEWVQPYDFSTKLAGLTKISATLTVLERQQGFVGKIAQIATTGANGLVRLFDAYDINPDRGTPKDLYIEFDYKIVSGSWKLASYTLPTRTGVVEPNTVALPDTATPKRYRIKYTAAQIAAITAGNKLVTYFYGTTSGVEMWFGNVKVWQGEEGAEMPNEDRVMPTLAQILNEVNPSKVQLEAALAGNTSSASGPIRAGRNLRISCAGSSVTWGDGFLQSVAVKELITRYQKEAGVVIEESGVTVSGATANTLLNGANDRKLFGGKARKITGTNAQIAFGITGDELSIVQLIERAATNAATVQLWVDGALYDTFDNRNLAASGSETKNFTGDGTQTKFDLGRCFTYGHAVTVGGVAKVGALFQGGYGGSIPGGDDYMIIRKYGPHPTTGATEVHHWLWMKVAPAGGIAIATTFSYGEEIGYEKTTVGKTAAGVLESAYGDGNVSYDINNPANLSSGLDFREVDERAVKTWRFAESKTRAIVLKISGLAVGASGTPYFAFNFATSRMLWFQNAGIGGWKSKLFNENTALCSYRQIVDFNPDVLIYESGPNDDWDVKGHKLSTIQNGLTLTQLRATRTFPAKSIAYQSGSSTYDFQKWVGKIEAIETGRVLILADSTHVINTTPAVGDVVMIGAYFSNNKEYVSRLVKSYDPATRWITFDRPINKRDYIYSSLGQFVGMEVRVRDLSVYVNETRKLIDSIRASVPDVKVAMLPNPLPNLQDRELWGYPEKLDELADVLDAYTVDMGLVYDWQYSIPKDSATITIDAATLTTDSETGRKVADLTSQNAGDNYFNYEVIVGGVNVYGTDAVVNTGRTYAPDPALSTTGLNMDTSSSDTKAKQVLTTKKPRLEFLQNAPASGNITIKYSNFRWSSDSCHTANDSSAAKLYGTAYVQAVRDLAALVESSRKRALTLDPATATVQQLAQAMLDAGLIRKY